MRVGDNGALCVWPLIFTRHVEALSNDLCEEAHPLMVRTVWSVVGEGVDVSLHYRCG